MSAVPPSPAPTALSRAAFVDRFGGVYEHSPWVAENAFDAGLGADAATPAGLSAALHAQVMAGGRDRQLALLRAHPDLAGKLALAGGLTADSTAEQAGAGLDQCTPEELEAQRTAGIPIGRPNDPEDIADMALFLAGPAARNITGQAFNVDGGLVMY